MAGSIRNFSESRWRAQNKLKPADLKQSLQNTPSTNRHTMHDDVRMRNNAPGVPSCPEQINITMADKLPLGGGASRKSLLLDEQRFLNFEQLEEELEEALAQLSAKKLEFANLVLNGHTLIDAYRKAGMTGIENPTPQQLDNMRAKASRVRSSDAVSKYISSTLRLRHMEAQAQVGFTEVQWLQMQRRLLAMAVGEVETPKVYIQDGQVREMKVKDAALGVAAKTLETIAKHYGYLSEKIDVTGGPTVILKDFTGGSDEDLSTPEPVEFETPDDIIEGEKVDDGSEDWL